MQRRSIAASIVLAISCAGAARAELPYPSNPQPCSGVAVPPACISATEFSRYLFLPPASPPVRPSDFSGTDWKLTSDKTGEAAIDSNSQELFGVKGASVDLAWQVTTGRPDVLIAVLDSGIRWQDSLPDVVNKFYLNRHELPIPEGSTNSVDPWDRNGDGVFNVQDYLSDAAHSQDSRVSDQNGNGLIDPEDLIFLFSDGVDDDGNGYIDDISGWDFFEDDNDALDEVRYGHGTGEAHDSSAEADNGGSVGTCPNCMLLMVRVGDSFVTDIGAFGVGAVFAVDSGASVIQEALGTLNNSSFAQQAVDYAYDHGVVTIASAADEESNHHNYPANLNHTVIVNSVTKYAELSGIVQTPHSYLYLNG
ncbi:MAG TPA: S8 family serine peptidase, partial [Candidatus Acidoferrales bacterium]|nr:S8 family serine peptidase [Candidatus Acidoferrales bacterium]